VLPESVTAKTVAELKTVVRNIVDTPVPGQPPDRFGGQKGARLESARAATADRPLNRPTPRTVAWPQALYGHRWTASREQAAADPCRAGLREARRGGPRRHAQAAAGIPQE